jgi:GxxExxY protein
MTRTRLGTGACGLSISAQRHRDQEEEEMVFGEEAIKADDDPVTREIIGAAIEVHRGLGPGLLESVYEDVLSQEVAGRGLEVRRQVSVPLMWKGRELSHPLRLDLLVADSVIVEVKAIEDVLKVHKAQLLSYMRLSGKRRGLLLNFHVAMLKNGITRCSL